MCNQCIHTIASLPSDHVISFSPRINIAKWRAFLCAFWKKMSYSLEKIGLTTYYPRQSDLGRGFRCLMSSWLPVVWGGAAQQCGRMNGSILNLSHWSYPLISCPTDLAPRLWGGGRWVCFYPRPCRHVL